MAEEKLVPQGVKLDVLIEYMRKLVIASHTGKVNIEMNLRGGTLTWVEVTHKKKLDL